MFTMHATHVTRADLKIHHTESLELLLQEEVRSEALSCQVNNYEAHACMHASFLFHRVYNA